jgi:hypothetical protein
MIADGVNADKNLPLPDDFWSFNMEEPVKVCLVKLSLDCDL